MEGKKLSDVVLDIKAYKNSRNKGIRMVTNICVVGMGMMYLAAVILSEFHVIPNAFLFIGVFVITVVVVWWRLENVVVKQLLKDYIRYEGETVCIDEEGWHQWGKEDFTKTWEELWMIELKANAYFIWFGPYEHGIPLDSNKLTTKEKELLERANENRLPGIFQQLDVDTIKKENTRGQCYDIVLTEALQKRGLKKQLSVFHFPFNIVCIILLFSCWPMLIIFLIIKAVLLQVALKENRRYPMVTQT